MAETRTKESILPPLWVLSTAAVVLVFWLLMQLREIVTLLVVGYSIAYALDPVLDAFERRKVSRGVGLVIVILAFLLVVVLLAVTAVPTLIEQYALLSSNLPSYIKTVQTRLLDSQNWVMESLPPLIAEKLKSFSYNDILPSFDSETLNRILNGVFGTLLQGYSITLTLVNLSLLPFIVYYIAVDFSSIYTGFLALFPAKNKAHMKEILDEINELVSAFIRGQALVALVMFVLYSIGLSIVGVKLWLLIAVIAGFGNVIPYVGTVLGITLGTVMALVTFGDFHHVLYVWLVFVVVQTMEGFLVTPRIVGEKTGFSPLVIILALFAGGALFGLLGLFLAIPGAAVLKVLLKHGHRDLLSRIQG